MEPLSQGALLTGAFYRRETLSKAAFVEGSLCRREPLSKGASVEGSHCRREPLSKGAFCRRDPLSSIYLYSLRGVSCVNRSGALAAQGASDAVDDGLCA